MQLSELETLRPMDELSVIYYGYVFDASGYGHAARAYIRALHSAGIKLCVVDLANHAGQVSDELTESLLNRPLDPDFHIFHGIPTEWARLAFRLPNAIGMTVWETDIMPTQWSNALNHVLQVWLPCEFNQRVFGSALEKPVFRLPHPISRTASNDKPSDPDQFLRVTDGDFVFYSIFEWQERKCPVGLISAYLRAFTAKDDAVLIIKTNPGAASLARQALDQTRQLVPSDGRVEIRPEAWSSAQLQTLHERGNCYVSLHRGEGWGYPLFEAASRGTPVVATAYSGPMDYLNAADHHLVRYQLIPVRQPYLYYHPRMRWADPDLTHAAELMRWVCEHRQMAAEKAARAAPCIQNAYATGVVGAMARNRLMDLLKQTQPQKYEQVKRAEKARLLSPPVPIPADWYDKDYFETGIKSNWDQGYKWPLFVGLFRETANFLISVFPEASSFLDIGCGKGFLVRCLREAGKECWGFDYSRWAIDHTEECVRPFVRLASVEDVTSDRQFDLLLSFEVFEHLTESQIRSFLGRARTWTRMGLLATIPSFENDEEQKLYQKNDRDLSHVTFRPRRWWHEVFLTAGWRQDAIHRVAERVCQNHELPRKMSWKVYLYAPE